MQTEQTDRENYDSFVLPPAATQATPDGDEAEGADQPVKVVDGDGKKQLVAYVIVWGATSSIRRDGFRHRFNRGAITWTDPVTALWSHNYETPLASTANKTLALSEDDYGVLATIDLDETTDGANAYTRVKNRLVTGMSFGGKRLAYDRTGDPKVINVTSFVADEISITVIPGMVETNIVTAGNEDQLRKVNLQSQTLKLQKFKLAMLR